MANPNRPQGFIPVSHINGSDWDGKTSLYYVQQSDTNPLAVGDAVVSVPGSASALVLGTYQEGLQLVTKASGAAGSLIRGVVVSIIADPIDLGLTALPGVKTKGYLINVADDPLLIFKVIGDNSAAVANTVVGSFAGFNTTAPSSAYGVSQETLATGTVSSASNLPLRILGLHTGDLSANCHFRVVFNTHELGSGAALALAAGGASATISLAGSRTALSTDSGGTFELANGVTYTLSDAVPLPAGVVLLGPSSGSATLAVTGAATMNGSASSITVAAGSAYSAIPRATSSAAYVVKGS